jgi:glutathione S-transferase
MPALTLYTNPQSRGRIAHWMLEEIGEPYETVWVDYGAPMKSPGYLAIHPMGKAVVTEAAAICAYLAEAFPDKGLLPRDARERADYWRWLFFAAGPLEQAVTARTLGWQVPSGREAMVGFGRYEDVLAALEALLASRPYVCGERFTAADVYVGAQVGWGLLARDAWRRSAQLNQERLAAQGG